MGRPKVNDSDKRIVQVNIRLTIEENNKVNQYASASGITPANWIRIKVFTGKFPAVKMSPIENSFYQELKKIGVNLNQITHRVNQGTAPREYLILQAQLISLLNKTLNALLNDRQSDQG